MAKQTFTTGQVLTAAQMTSLQQTAMGGGSTTAKTASYVLVAADAGTVVQMNSASATTITVNTALFAAGDTVEIQNVGAGICTVTAGSATVSTAGSLALAQYEGGKLYFNTTSAALFFDIVQSAAGGAYTSLASGSMASTVSITSISGSFTDLYLVLDNVVTSVNDQAGVRINNDTTAANYVGVSTRQITGTGPTTQAQTFSFVDVTCGSSFLTLQTGNAFVVRFSNYAQTTGQKTVVSQGIHSNNLTTFTAGQNVVGYRSTSAITRLDLVTAGSSWAAQGTYTLYGVK